jgi:hypothetical protein
VTPDDRPTPAGSGWAALTLRLTLRAVINPRLAVDLLRVLWAFRTRAWYRRWPFLPLPPRDYVRWRMYTAYGDERAIPPLEDVVRFAQWRRRVMHL